MTAASARRQLGPSTCRRRPPPSKHPRKWTSVPRVLELSACRFQQLVFCGFVRDAGAGSSVRASRLRGAQSQHRLPLHSATTCVTYTAGSWRQTKGTVDVVNPSRLKDRGGNCYAGLQPHGALFARRKTRPKVACLFCTVQAIAAVLQTRNALQGQELLQQRSKRASRGQPIDKRKV